MTGLDTFQAKEPPNFNQLHPTNPGAQHSLEQSPNSVTARIDGLSSSSIIQGGTLISSDKCELSPPPVLTHELVHDTAAIELFTGKLSTDEESQLQRPLLPASHSVLIARTTTSNNPPQKDWYSSPTSTLLDCVSTASESQLSSETHAQQSQQSSLDVDE